MNLNVVQTLGNVVQGINPDLPGDVYTTNQALLKADAREERELGGEFFEMIREMYDRLQALSKGNGTPSAVVPSVVVPVREERWKYFRSSR